MLKKFKRQKMNNSVSQTFRITFAIYANIRINGIFIWSYQKNVVYLHREPALGMSAHLRRRVADIIKGVYWRLFWSIGIRKISQPKARER